MVKTAHISYQEGEAVNQGTSKDFQNKSKAAYHCARRRVDAQIEADRVKYQLTGISVFCEDSEMEKQVTRIIKNLQNFTPIFARKPYCEKNIKDSIEQIGLNSHQSIEITGEKTTLNVNGMTVQFGKLGEAMFSICRIS